MFGKGKRIYIMYEINIAYPENQYLCCFYLLLQWARCRRSPP